MDILEAGLRLWAPLALAAMGGVLSERAGIVNIGLEAMLLAGAFASVALAALSGSLLVGVLAGIVAGALIGLFHAWLTQALRVPHILSGVGLNLGLLGLTTYGLRLYGSTGPSSPSTLPPFVSVLIAVVVVVKVTFVLARTPFGLRLRACGENPEAALSAGVPVTRLRYAALAASGAAAGLGGVLLALGSLGAFSENMSAGRGYIALAAVIFGRWDPLGAAAAALLFGLGDALAFGLQTRGLTNAIPSDFVNLLPYVVTLLALAVRSGKNVAPAALGQTDPA